jgi:TOBE domain
MLSVTTSLAKISILPPAASAGWPVRIRLAPPLSAYAPKTKDFGTTGDGISLARVTLDVDEHLGPETMVHSELAGNQHVARLNADTAAQSGDQLTLSFRPGLYHLFANDAAGRQLN